jgi:hypothetical protein
MVRREVSYALGRTDAIVKRKPSGSLTRKMRMPHGVSVNGVSSTAPASSALRASASTSCRVVI